jgi:Na+/H+-dicarboxylate symporter
MSEQPAPSSAGVWWVLAAMLAGALIGWAAGADGRLLGVEVIPFCEFLGNAFLALLKMLIVPLVMASIISGVATYSEGAALGRLGLTAVAFYVLTTLIAVLIALGVNHLLTPGLVGGEPARDLLALHADASQVAEQVRHQAGTGVFDLLLAAIPSNIVEAASSTRLVALVVFSALFGYHLARIEEPWRGSLTTFWQAVFRVMMRMAQFVMRLAPLGVLGLTARVVARTGFGAAGPLLVFGGGVVLSLLLYALVALPLLLRLTGARRPYGLLPAFAPALLTAFASASSAASLPLALNCAEQRLRIPARIAGLVIPLGGSINHAGTALYECAAALFIAQAYGLELALGTQVTVVALALLTSMGIAGVPAASLVGITVILGAVGLPAEGVGVLLVLDRLLDMARTAVNVLSDGACAAIVARLAGERDVLSGRAD